MRDLKMEFYRCHKTAQEEYLPPAVADVIEVTRARFEGVLGWTWECDRAAARKKTWRRAQRSLTCCFLNSLHVLALVKPIRLNA